MKEQTDIEKAIDAVQNTILGGEIGHKFRQDGELICERVFDKETSQTILSCLEKCKGEDWQTIDSAPEDGEFYLYATMYNHVVTGYKNWEYYALRLDDEGQLREMSGDYFSTCNFEDFAYWSTLPTRPKLDEEA